MNSSVQGTDQRRREIKEKVLNDIYFGLVVLTIPLLIVSWFRFNDLERMDLFATMLVPILLCVIYFVRNHLSFNLRAWILIVTMYLSGTYAYLTVSVLSIGLSMMFGSSVIATMLLRPKMARIVAFVNGSTLFIIASLAIRKVLVFNVSLSEVLNSPESWTVQIFGLLIMVFTLALGIRRINTFNEGFINELQDKNDELTLAFKEIRTMDNRLQSNKQQLDETKQEATNNEAFYKTLFNSMDQLVFTMDLEGRFEIVNDYFLTMFKTNEDAVYGKHLNDVFKIEQSISSFDAMIERTIETGDKVTEFNTFKDPFGRLQTYEVTILPIYIDGKVEKLMGASRNITDLLAKEETIKRLAYEDGLTQLNNLTAFKEYINKLTSQFTIGTFPFAIVLVDIDHFKSINDAIGHMEGDALLTMIASRIDSINADYCARIGGDEFALVFTIQDMDHDFDSIARSIRDAFIEPFVLHDNSYSITVSSGLSLYPYTGNTYDELFAAADYTLFEAKRKGANQHISNIG